MSGDALADLLLAAVCAYLFFANLGRRPGIALACATLGLAAAFGVAFYLGAAPASGPHRFFSLMSSCAALPLLADAVAWPDGEPARTQRGAALYLFTGTLLAVFLVVVLGIRPWAKLAPALAAGLLVCGTLRARRLLPLLGAGLLLFTFALMASGAARRPLDPTQVLHYGLAAALLLIVGVRPHRGR